MADLLRTILTGNVDSALGRGVKQFITGPERRSLTHHILSSITVSRPYGGAVYSYLGRPTVSRLRRKGVIAGMPREFAYY